jgi:hypothetical protein
MATAALALLLLGCIHAGAFLAVSPFDDPDSPPPVLDAYGDPKRLSFHKDLQRAGKTVFRPGGSQVTHIMHGWADFSNDGCYVLELSAGLGTGGMALAAERGCHVLLTDQDEERLEQAKTLAKKRGLGSLISSKRVDMTNIDRDLGVEQFDAAIVEASLTHYPDALKRKILQDLLKHSDQLLLHEIGLRGTSEDSEKAKQVSREVGSALAIGFHPLTVPGWKKILDECGYKITNLDYGPMRVLSPRSMLQDEGPAGVAKIAWNLATHKDLRMRVVSTKAVIESHTDTLGYIALRAIKK